MCSIFFRFSCDHLGECFRTRISSRLSQHQFVPIKTVISLVLHSARICTKLFEPFLCPISADVRGVRVCAGLCAGVWASSDRLYRRTRRSAERSGARRCSACRAYHRVAHTHAHRHAHTHLNVCKIAPSAIRPHDQFTRQPNPYLEKNQTENEHNQQHIIHLDMANTTTITVQM